MVNGWDSTARTLGSTSNRIRKSRSRVDSKATAESFLKGYNDPRLPVYALPATDPDLGNVILGVRTGAAFSTGHITHGLANAMYLPYVIQYNAKDATAALRYAEIANAIGITGTPQECIDQLCERIVEFNQYMKIPNTLKEFGIVEEEFKEKIKMISENAVGDACTGSNPRSIDPATMERLFQCIYYGEKVNF